MTFTFIVFIINMILVFILRRSLYIRKTVYEGRFKEIKHERLKIPLYVYILIFITSLVPILNVIVFIVIIVLPIIAISEGNLSFKCENSIFKFLTKKI